jgi:hypothetical protein
MATMPMRIALPTLRAMSTAIRITPSAASRNAGSETLPSATKVAGIGDDDIGVAQPDERDEQTDAGGGAVFQAIGNAVDDLLANVGEREQQEQHAGKKHDAERGLPRNAAADDDRVGEIGVERHSGREGDGIVGPQAHDQSGERGGNTSGEEHAFDGHSGFGEDSRVHHHDVTHGHERGDAGEQLGADGGFVFAKMEDALEHAGFSPKNEGQYRLRE